MSRLGERLLLALSRSIDAGDYPEGERILQVDTALDWLLRNYPGLEQEIPGSRILDFGCGSGHQAVSLARRGAAFVLGLDINPATLAGARRLAETHRAGPTLQFAETMPEGMDGTFDLVLSLNSMEHFPDPLAALRQMRAAARPGGDLLVAFGCPWYSPYGAHMHFFTRVPWVHLLFSERTVMAVRRRFRSDGARRYEEVESGLNRMSIAKFERLTGAAGLTVAARRYVPVKGVTPLTTLPVLRELFINFVIARLRVPETRAATGGGAPVSAPR